MNGDLAKDINEQPTNVVFNDCNVCKSIWLRHNTVSTDLLNWKFLEGELYFVLRSGLIFWIVYILSQAF